MTDFAPLRFSTGDLPLRERVSHWRDVARQVVRVDISPLSDSPFDVAATLRALPGLRSVSWVSSAARFERTPAIVAKGEDTLGVVINLGGTMTALQRNREVSFGVGDAALMLHSEPAALIHSEIAAPVQSQGRSLCIVLQRAMLAPLVRHIEDAASCPVPRSNESLRLLVNYLRALREEPVLAQSELRHLVVAHVYDLVAMMIGATRDGAAIASERGVRAARLAAIKTDIVSRLGSRDLSLAAAAARQRVTPRYVQLLFEREGTTFSQFVLEQRLARAHQMLTSQHHAGWTISAIALAAGFGDLSHFNRSFRRRYGATPSDVRSAA